MIEPGCLTLKQLTITTLWLSSLSTEIHGKHRRLRLASLSYRHLMYHQQAAQKVERLSSTSWNIEFKNVMNVESHDSLHE